MTTQKLLMQRRNELKRLNEEAQRVLVYAGEVAEKTSRALVEAERKLRRALRRTQ